MHRRGFLSLLGLGAAGLVLDPERLLWVPGAKTIFLPPKLPILTFKGAPFVFDPIGGINRVTFTFWRNQPDVFVWSPFLAELGYAHLAHSQVSPADCAIRVA